MSCALGIRQLHKQEINLRHNIIRLVPTPTVHSKLLMSQMGYQWIKRCSSQMNNTMIVYPSRLIITYTLMYNYPVSFYDIMSIHIYIYICSVYACNYIKQLAVFSTNWFLPQTCNMSAKVRILTYAARSCSPRSAPAWYSTQTCPTLSSQRLGHKFIMLLGFNGYFQCQMSHFAKSSKIDRFFGFSYTRN